MPSVQLRRSSGLPFHGFGSRLGLSATGLVLAIVAALGALVFADTSSAKTFDDASCTSESFCAAVGTSDQSSSNAQVKMWDGEEWSSQWTPKPEDATAAVLSGVFCASAEKCLAVGSYEDDEGATNGLALRWGGGHWSPVEVPSSEGAMDVELSGVTCHSYPTCIAVGRWTVEGTTGGLAMAWDGESWTASPTPNPSGATASELSDLSCASETACIAVGTYTNSSEATKALSVGWDGSEWSEIETPSPAGATQSELADVACQASGACTAIGSYLDADGIRRTLAMSRTSSWTIATTGEMQGASEARLSGLACPSSSLCVAVGSAEIDGEQMPLRQGWDGSSWAEPEASGPPFASHGSRLAAVSCLESGRCTAVGSVEYTDYTDSENLAYALQGEEMALTEWGEGFARSWTRKRLSPSTSALTDVACPSSTCIEVGHHTDASGVKHAQATTWSSAGEAPPAALAAPEPGGASSSELSGVSCLSASSCVGVGSYVEGGTAKTLALSWNGSAWSVVSSPNPSGAAASRLNGVSCVSSSLCLALGSYLSGGVKKTLALRWNGSAWSIVSSPNPVGALSSQLADLSCASSTSCTGVGHYTDSAGVRRTLAVSWNDGTQSWGIIASPNPSGAEESRLIDVSCTSSSNCFAVGAWSDEDEVQTAFALKWNGSEWSTSSLSLPSGASSSRLAGISCVSGTDCTAIGTYADGTEELALALRWNGTAWSHSALDPLDGAAAQRPVAVSCVSGSSCHASGSVLYPGFRARNLAYHFDGTGWEVVEQGGLGGELRGISCVAGEDVEVEGGEGQRECIAAGELRLQPTQGDGARSPANWRLSEEQWSAFPATSAGDKWADVSCAEIDECMIVGSAAGSPITTRALRWNGTSWANTSPQNKSEAPSNFLEGVSCSTASRCVAVGYYRPDNTTPEKLLPLAQSWNGTSWSLQTVPAPTVSGTARAKLADVSCTAADFCVAVGSYEDGGQSHGLIERWNGSSWTLATIAAPAESSGFGLTGISCTSKSRCVAVGSYEGSESQHGYLTEWNGVSWSAASHPAPDSSYLSDVACVSGSECVAVGSHAIGWDGSEWSAEPIARPAQGGGYRLDSVSCDGAGGCVASGYQFALDAPEIREPLALVAFGEPESSIDDLPAEEDPEVELPERNWSAEEVWPSTSELIDVACPSSTNCVGVGKYTDMDGEVEIEALSWNGSSWSERAVPTPSGATESTLEGVSCTSTSSCVAVGSYLNAEEVTKTLAMKWNGTAWSIVSSPNPSGAEISKLADVHCASSSFCIATGGYLDPTTEQGKPLVLKWTGSEWQNVSVPSPDGGLGSELAGVWCTSTTACVAVGMTVNEEGLRRNLALRLSGSTWSLLGPPSPVGDSRLADVHCTSATACVAVGDHLLSSGAAKTLAMRWNGESWATDDTPSPGSYLSSLSSISCASASQCNAVGMSGDGSSQDPLALELEGGSWTVRGTEPLSAESDADVFRASLGGIACVSGSQCMSVGAVETQNSGSPESEEQPDRNLAYSFDGTDWDLAQFAGPPVSSIGGVSCPLSAPTNCMAVGRSDDLSDAHGAVDTAWKLQEGKWDPLPMPGDVWSSLSDLSCSAADKCTTVGSSDAGQFVVVRWNGTEWATQSPPTPGSGYDHELTGVSCSTATSCIAVGGSKTSSEVSVPRAISWNGTSWSSMTIAAPSGAQSTTLGDVACTSASACTAVGEYRDSEDEIHAFVQRWNGSSWTTTLIADPFEAIEASLSGVTCLSTTDCTAVGSYKLSEAEESRRSFVVRWNGTTWTAQTVPHPEEGSAGRTELRDVSCASAAECIAVGETTAGESDYSLVLAWDGTQWSVEAGFLPNGTATPQLTSVSCGTGDGCVAGGWSHDGTEALVARGGSEFEEEVAPFAREATYVAGAPSAEIAKVSKCKVNGNWKAKYNVKNIDREEYFDAWTLSDWCYKDKDVKWDYHTAHKKKKKGFHTHGWWTSLSVKFKNIRCAGWGNRGEYCFAQATVWASGIDDGAFPPSLEPGPKVYSSCLETEFFGDGWHERAVKPGGCPTLSSSSNPSPGGGGGGSEEPPEIEEPPPAPTPPPIDPAKDGDVNGDDKADLVTLHTSGDIHTLNGVNAADKVTSGVDSALFRGPNHNVVDVSDVDADGYSDLISLCFVDQVCVRRGKSDNSFDTGMVVRTDVVSGTRSPKGHEPIGVADVTGDLRGDLVTFYPPEGNFYVYPGEEYGLFGKGMTLGGENIDSALFDRQGLYFLDVADVNGDEYADVVALDTSGDAEVYPGTEEGVQQASTRVNPAVDPIMADGIGHEPIGVGDVNADGKADLATLTPGGQVAVYAGTSEKVAPDNHLRYLKTDPVLSHSALDSSLTDEVGDDFVGLMDRTGDGKVDLVKVSAEGAISVAPGQSDLKFGTFASFASGINPNRFARVGYEQAFEKPFIRRVGCSPIGCIDRPTPIESDVDGDLRADLVTMESAKNAIHVYRAMGERGHEVSAGPGVPPYDTPNYMANSALLDGVGHHVIDVADVTGDWHADTVTLHDNGSVYVFPANSNGNATFGPGRASLAGSMTPGPYSPSGYEPIAVADVTGDAIGDLVVFKPGQGVKLYPGDPGGFFGAPITSLSTANSARFDQTGYHFLDVVDVNGDRRGDLVASSAEDDAIVVFRGNSNGTFVSDGVSDLPLRLDEGAGQELVGLGDVNGDHRADLTTLVAGTVNVYEGKSSGGFATKKAGAFAPAGTSFAGSLDSNLFDQSGDEVVGLLDENGDRKADLVTARSDGSARIYLGKANFTFNTTPTVRTISGFSSVRFNKPSGHEVVNEKPPALRAGCTVSGCPWPPIKFVRPEGDVDGDYRADLVTVDRNGNAQIYAGAGLGFRTDPTTSLEGELDPALIDGKGHYLVDVADVNDDDNSDLVTVKDEGKVLVHPGTEERTFETVLDTGISLPPVMNGKGPNEPIAVADVTGDGFDDLIVFVGPGSGSIKVYKGQLDGKFNTTGVQSQSGTFDSALLDNSGSYFLGVVDVSGDGLADLVSMKTTGYTYAYKGQSDGKFAAASGSIVTDPIMNDGFGHEPVGLGDVDGDGRGDLLTIDPSGVPRLFKGQENGSFGSFQSVSSSIIDSNLTDGIGEEVIGLLDFDGDGHLDLISNEDGDMLLYKGLANATFEAPMTVEADLEPVRGYVSSGHEFATEQPYLRRVGCQADGCALNFLPPQSGTPKFALKTGAGGTGNGQFFSPSAAAVDSAGNIWVADTSNHRIQKFNDKGEYQSKFGAKGTGNGQLDSPRGLTVDSAGNIWVADTGNNRIQKFNNKGEYQSKFGSYGEANGQFYSPSAAAVDSAGNIWVADTGNHRIQKFNSKGEYLTKVGFKGTGNAQFSAPSGLAIGTVGNIWVADTGNNRIQKFNEKGEYVAKFGTKGTGNGQFSGPNGLAFSSEGSLWVADGGNDRVQRFAENGAYLGQLGSEGTYDGQFQYPTGVAVDSSGSVWVLDQSAHRLQKWTLASSPDAPEASTENPTGIGFGDVTLKGTVNPKGFDTRYYFEYGTTTSYGTKVPISAKGIGSGTANVSVSQAIDGLTDKTTYHYRVVATGPGGTTLGQDREFKTLAAVPVVAANSTAVNSNDARLQAQIDPNGYATQYLFQYGTTTSYGQAMPLSPKSVGSGTGPVGVNAVVSGLEPETTYHFRVAAANSEGGAFSADGQFTTRGEGALTLSPTPEFELDLGDTESEETFLNQPTGVAVDAEGNLWAVESWEGRVLKFSPEGEYLQQFGSWGTGTGKLNEPAGIAIDAQGDVWVADSGNARIQEFDAEGTFKRQFGSWGTATGKLNAPAGVAIDAEGDVWVADTGNHRIQEFSSTGSFIRQAGTGELFYPAGLDIDSEGNVWVADTGNNRIYQFGPAGESLQQFGSEGPGDGEFWSLSGLAVDPEGNIWASDSILNRVQQFNPAGEYLQQFGEEGAAPGQFSGMLAGMPSVGIGPEGSIWVADGGGHRVEKWVPGLFGGGP